MLGKRQASGISNRGSVGIIGGGRPMWLRGFRGAPRVPVIPLVGPCVCSPTDRVKLVGCCLFCKLFAPALPCDKYGCIDREAEDPAVAGLCV